MKTLESAEKSFLGFGGGVNAAIAKKARELEFGPRKVERGKAG